MPSEVDNPKSSRANLLFQRNANGSPRKSTRFLLVALSFGILLLLPLADQFFRLSAGFRSTEKRQLAPMPVLHFPRVMTYVHEFNQYFKENFGGRNILFYYYSRWKFGVLNTSPLPEKVMIGKNGWFYPGNSLAQVSDQHRGISPFTPADLQAISTRLGEYRRALAKQGTRLYVLIAPDSYSIYPENLPDTFRALPSPSNYDRLNRYVVAHGDIPLIDVRDSLRRAKAINRMYYQTDTHWTNYGALVATLALVARLKQDFSQIPAPRLSDYRPRRIPGGGGDLVTMLALNYDIIDSVDYQFGTAPHLATRLTESMANPEMNLPTQRFVSGNAQSPRLLLIGDSFSYSMNQFVPGYFRETLIIRSSKLDTALIRREHPDIIVIEIVERNLKLLADF